MKGRRWVWGLPLAGAVTIGWLCWPSPPLGPVPCLKPYIVSSNRVEDFKGGTKWTRYQTYEIVLSIPEARARGLLVANGYVDIASAGIYDSPTDTRVWFTDSTKTPVAMTVYVPVRNLPWYVVAWENIKERIGH
jgi:hypothetical protein